MAKRSLKASPDGQAQAKQAMLCRGWTQEYLAIEAGLSTRNSVWKFLTGRPVDRNIFMEICFQLDLDWQDIADLPTFPLEKVKATEPVDRPVTDESLKTTTIPDVPDLAIIKTKFKVLVDTWCSRLPSYVDSNQSLLLTEVYVDVQVFPFAPDQQWLAQQNSLTGLRANTFSNQRLAPTSKREQSVSALESVLQHNHVMVLGKPGTGKTLFLKYLALQCYGQSAGFDLLPIFVSLRSFVEFIEAYENADLFSYLEHILRQAALSEAEVDYLFEQHKLLLLLNAFDEVSVEKADFVYQKIYQFTEKYHQNKIIISCRSASQNYYFQGFTHLELAGFSSPQIQQFTQRWFSATLQDSEQGEQKAAQFLETLSRQDNQAIQELAHTPILLALLCSVFLARSEFPNKRSRLYQEALAILLTRWDQTRGIKRDQIYEIGRAHV